MKKNVKQQPKNDNERINSIKTPKNDLLDVFAMQPIAPNSLIIRNGVMYVLGGVSSGKSTLLSKLIKLYDETIEPLIFCFYAGFAPDETTTFHLSNYQLKHKPYFIQLPTPESMIAFFDQFRRKRLKYSELLMFSKSLFKSDTGLFECLRVARSLFGELSKKFDVPDYMKRVHTLMAIIEEHVNLSAPPYASDYVLKTYAKKRKIGFQVDPLLFMANVCVSLSKALKPTIITVPQLTESRRTLDRFKPYSIEPMIRYVKSKRETQLIPSVCVFDDVAQFPMLTSEHPAQWVKDLFAETRRWQNTFIIAAQRHNLLNKSLRALTHTFFIGYSLIDDDLPRIAKEMPSNILAGPDFLELYKSSIKPFTFFVYNNKLGFDIVKLKK